MEAIEEHVKTFLRHGLPRPNRSEWGSNAVMVKSLTVVYVFCVDYSQLNLATIKDCYPFPRIDACLDAFDEARWFSTFELMSGYQQVSMDLRDANNITFITQNGSYCFQAMPFGLCNAPATYQSLRNVVLSGLNQEILLVYLDDVIIHSVDLESHLVRVESFLARLRIAKLKLKVSKCRLLQREVHFIGHVVSESGIGIDPSKIEAVTSWPVLHNLNEVRSFIGLCAWYREFVQNFSALAHHLHDLTRKGHKFAWTGACQEAFETLRERLMTSPSSRCPLMQVDSSWT